MGKTIHSSLYIAIFIFASYTINAQITTADFSASPQLTCGGTTIQFQDLSTSSNTITTWAWDFGDGNFSSLQNPTHAYNVSAVTSFTVCLSVTDNMGNSDTECKVNHISISPSPNVGFTTTGTLTGCGPLTVTFNDTTQLSASRTWYFTNGTQIDSVISPTTTYTHTFTQGGNWDVTLKVNNAFGCVSSFTSNALVTVDNPIVDFSANSQFGCGNLPASITFNNLTMPSTNMSYLWHFGDGTTSTSANPTHSYNNYGTYTVKLIATDNTTNCVDSIVKNNYIEIKGLCANFVAQPDTQGCSPLPVNFFSTSSGQNPILVHEWLIDGQTFFDTAVGKVFTNVGSYDIRLIVTDILGNRDTLIRQNYITVVESPMASFTATPDAGCDQIDVQFTNTSTPNGGSPITNYLWLTDNTFALTENNSHSYTSPGSYSVFLEVTNADGCKDNILMDSLINVYPSPQAGFTYTELSSCDSVTTISFTDTTNHPTPLDYLWDFGDGNTSISQSPTHNYTSFGSFTVTLITTDPFSGCSDTATQNITINLSNIANFSYSPISSCVGDTITFTDSSVGNIIGWNWDFGDGNTSNLQNPSHIYTTGGCYTVTLTTTFVGGCTATHTVDCIQTNDFPTVSYTITSGDTISCNTPHNVTFSSNITGAANFYWNFDGQNQSPNDPNPTHAFTAQGNYPVELVAISPAGCTTSTTINTIVIGALDVNFGADVVSGCTPLQVMFSDSTTSPFPITGLTWDFGDTTIVNIQQPTRTYTSTGLYDVKLIATNSLGCIDSVTFQNFIAVGDTPNIAFTASPTANCVGGDVFFTNQSDSVNTTYYWNFGDGNISTDTHPVHAYNSLGTYTVSLAVSNYGCSDTLVQQDLITITPPIAYFDVTYDCDAPLTVTFNDLSIGANNYFWDFGDGSPINTSPSPTHTYSDTGSYSVNLVVVNNTNNCQHGYTETISLIIPQAHFSYTAVDSCTPAPASLAMIDSSINADTYSWILGNGGTFINGSGVPSPQDSNSAQPVIQYDSAGYYDLTLIVTDERGCSDTTMQQICIADVFPNATIDSSSLNILQLQCGINSYVDSTGQMVTDSLACYWSGCAPLTVSFADSSYSFPDTVTSWFWDFGNGDTSTLPNPTYTYTQPSNEEVYQVVLTVTNGFGSIRRDTVAEIRPTQPVARFELQDSTTCTGRDIGLTNFSSGVGITYAWDFGNGDVATDRTPTYMYPLEGSYNICLTVTDINGCDSTYCDSIRIGNPVAMFSIDTGYSDCEALTVTFTSDSSLNAVAWFWDFGTGNPNDVSTLANPTFTYTVSDTYSVCLIVTNLAGCQDTLCQTDIIVVDGPRASFTTDPTAGCIDHDVTFAATGVDVAKYVWYFGTGDSIVNMSNALTDTVVYTYTTRGTYIPRLAVEDQFGCRREYIATTPISTTDPQADFTIDTTGGCAPLGINITNNSQDANQYNWYIPGATISNPNIAQPNITFANAGLYDTIQLVITDIHGCMDTMTNTQTISVSDVFAGFSTDTLGGCVPLPVQFIDTSSTFLGTITQLDWNMGDGTIYTNIGTVNHVYDTVPPNHGTRVASLTVTNSLGCTDVTSVTISPTFPDVYFESDTFACTGQTVNFNNFSSGVGVSYIWDFGDGDSSTAVNPTHVYSSEDTFTVCLTAVDVNGCDSTYCSQVIVANPVANFTSDITYANCPPAVVNFTDSSLNAVAWEWDFNNSSPPVFNQNPSTVYTQPGTFDAQLIVTSLSGCRDTLLMPNYMQVDGPTAIWSYTPDEGCVPLDVTFTVTGANVSQYTFDYGDGALLGIFNNDTTHVHTYDSSGVFTPILVVEDANGCVRTFIGDEDIEITDPQAHFTVSTDNSCVPFIVTTSSDSSQYANTYSWFAPNAFPSTSSDTSPTFIYNNAAIDTIILVVSDIHSCTDTFSRIITASTINPSASASVDIGCAPLSVDFNDNSMSFGDTISSWVWDFGDGDTATVANPTHIYTQAGTYIVNLTVTNNYGCIEFFAVDTIFVTQPIADFNTSQTFVCTGQSIDFINTSTGLGLSYSWDFGDGNGSTDTSVTHAYNLEGVYNVCLTVIDTNNCDSTLCHQITVANPVAGFEAIPSFISCPPAVFQLNDTSLNAVSWEWRIFNSTDSLVYIDTTQNISFTTTTPDVYSVQLAIVSPSGCTDTLYSSAALEVSGPLGDFSFAPLDGCDPHTVEFIVNNQNVSEYTLLYGNNDSLVVTNPMLVDTLYYTYDTGVFVPILKIRDSIGCERILPIVDTISVFGVEIDFTADNTLLCENGLVTFTPQNNTVLPIDSVRWIISGAANNTSTAINPTLSFNTLGLYDVTLITYTSLCSDTVYKQDYIRVAPNPVPNFSYGPNPICTDQPISLFDSSSIVSGSIVNWQWSDGQGYLENGQIPPFYTTSNSGTTNMTLTLTSDFGCMDSLTQAITVFQTPTADAGSDQQICINDVAYLNGSGVGAYQWSPANDLSCTTCPDPVSSALVTTTYTLQVTSTDGCIDTDMMTLTVGPDALPVIGLDNDTVTICRGEVTQLTAAGGVDVTSYVWDTSRAGLSCYVHCINPFASPDVTTTYVVQVTGVGGCIGYDSITVEVIDANGQLLGDDVTICRGDSFQLNVSTGVDPVWTNFGTLTCAFCPNPMAYPNVTTTYGVSVTTPNGCTIEDSITITVIPPESVGAGEDAVVCPGSSVQIIASGNGAVSWTPSVGLSDTTIFNPIASPTATTTYYMTVTNDLCTVIDTVTVTVTNQADISGEDVEICEGETAELEITGFAQTLTWSPSETLSDPGSYTPFATPTETTTYTVIGTLENCENDTTQITVTVHPTPDIDLLTNQQVAQGQSIVIAEGDPTYTYNWSPATYLNCTDCPSPIVSPDTNITYTVTYTDEFGCENTEEVNITLVNMCDEAMIGLPQAFTPNGDGLNDVFYVRSTSVQEVLEFQIYSQWGEPIVNRSRFATNDPAFGWDGTHNGEPANTGVYIYQVKVTCPVDGTVLFKKGNFLLMR